MPHLRIRGMKSHEIKDISKEMVDELQNIIGCPRDYFTLEYIPSIFILDGEESEGYPFVEVLWFDRGQEVQDKVAKAITDRIKKLEYEDVCVIFFNLAKDKYYENGEHF